MKKTALVVDDSPVTLKLLQRHLSQSDYEVITARDGREAAHMALEVGPDLIITDWEMPDMDGPEFCRTIRKSDGLGVVYIIIVTAHEEENRLVEAFDAGADDYLTKPVKQSELLARLRAGERIINLEADLQKKQREIVRSNAELEVAVGLLKESSAKLHHTAITDKLTGLPNRRAGMDQLRQQWAGADRNGNPLSCIMLDIDHFKRVNDTHGRGIGDLVLLKTANAIRQSARTHEVVCRVGGEEFLVVCENSTTEMAAIAAERLRSAVEGMTVTFKEVSLKVTISLGVAERTAQMESIDDLINAADTAMYDAKHAGRNRVCRFGAEAGEVCPGSDCINLAS